MAREHDVIDYRQVFGSADGDHLWFIEDGPSVAIATLIGEEY